jgi:Antitoxin Xre-like helix-turn-helix domain/Antitoxin Xre/MbcA/ParS C-terminal toxin-binding domain
MTTIAPPTNNAETRQKFSGTAVRVFFRLAEAWKLSTEEQMELLGSIGRSTLFDWKRSPKSVVLSTDQFARVSYLLGCYEALQRIWRRTPDEAGSWLRRPKAEHPFLGHAPLDFMVSGGIPALAAVRAYLDSTVGGPPSREWYVEPSREG